MANNHVTVNVGMNSGAVATGLAKVKNQLTSFAKFADTSLSGLFGGIAAAFTGTAILHQFGELYDRAKMISRLTKQFGVDSQELQKIGNVAQSKGMDYETVAVGFKKISLAQYDVRKGDREMIGSLKDLKISAQEFVSLSPEQAFYRLADAVKSSTDRQAAMHAIQQILGREGANLYAVLYKGSDALKQEGESFGLISNEALKAADHIKELGKQYEALKTRIFTSAGETIGLPIARALATGAEVGSKAIENYENSTKGFFGNLVKGNFKQAFANYKGALFPDPIAAYFDDKDVQKKVHEIWHPKKDDNSGDDKMPDSGPLASAKTEVFASNLTKAGLGGIAYFSSPSDPAERTAKAAEDTARSSRETADQLKQLRDHQRFTNVGPYGNGKH